MTTTDLLQVSYTPDLGRNDGLASLARVATDHLADQIVGGDPEGAWLRHHVDRVRAEWGLIRGTRGSDLLRLQLADGRDVVEYAYEPAELTRDGGWFAMNRAYSGLLAVTTRRLSNHLMASLGGVE